MVRGNWQRRVEKTQDRRNEAKEKKRRAEEKRLFKQMAHRLFELLDEHVTGLIKQWDKDLTIHIWVDSSSGKSTPASDLLADDDQGGKASTSKRRGRSGSTSEAPNSGKKKAHPRSKDVTMEPVIDDDAPLLLCRSQFFNGECAINQRSAKKSPCKCVHYNKKSKTLASVMQGKEKDKQATREIALAEGAYSAVHDDDADETEKKAMELLQYIELRLKPDHVNSQSLSEIISECLASNSCTNPSIVYLSVDAWLVFDRYREGLLISNQDHPQSHPNQPGGTRNRSVSLDGNELVFLPASILEHILTYLPDSAVAITSQVCRPWNKEIGKVSGFLWQFLLERRNWPIPQHSNLADLKPEDGGVHHPCREAFITAYRILRYLKSASQGISNIVSKRAAGEKERCHQSFSSRKNSPHYPNDCIALKAWSDNSILAAYWEDCSLRLYSALPKTAGESQCKEAVCQFLDPYMKTKKRSSMLMAVDLDKDWIGSLMSVTDTNKHAKSVLLIFVRREDFLLVGEDLHEKELMQFIDVGEAVRNYLLTCEDAGNGLIQLLDFLTNHGEAEEVEVVVSKTIAALGYGRFLVEVSVSIPNFDDDGSGDTLTVIMRKLIVFSAPIQSIIWIGDSHPTGPDDDAPLADSGMQIVSRQLQIPDNSGLTEFNFAVTGSNSKVLFGHIERTTFQTVPLTMISLQVNGPARAAGWNRMHNMRLSAVVSTGVVVSDCFSHQNQDDTSTYQSSLSFFSNTHTQETDGAIETLDLKGNLHVQELSVFDDDYIVAIGRLFPSDSEIDASTNDLGGHWFGPPQDSSSSIAVLIHVASRREIERVCLLENVEARLAFSSDEPELARVKILAGNELVASTVGWLGLVMTGQHIRDVMETITDDVQDDAKAQKKKKKKTPKKSSGKKDGFARGMSLRG